MLIRLIIFFLTAIIIPISSISQNGGYTLFRSFTVADGLPSNHIYNCVEDNQGFLWVATDAGIARFDGKRFQTFTTKDGLPDDEVLDVVKENNGRIWVNCFKQGPAYFDAIENRFVTGKQDSNLAKVSGTRSIQLATLKYGGVMYWNEIGSYLFINGKLTQFVFEGSKILPGYIIQEYGDGSLITYGGSKNTHALLQIKDDKVIDSLYLGNWDNRGNRKNVVQNNKFYMANLDSGVTHILSTFQTNPLRCRIDSVSIGEPIFWPRVTPKYFTVISRKGVTFIFDKQNLQFQFALSGNYSPNNIFNDTKENIWICSVDKGLLLYKKKHIETYAIPDNFTNTHFLSIARKPNGVLLAGNFYGQIAETDGKYFIVHSLPKTTTTGWQRKIIVLQSKIFSFSEGGTYINFSIPILNPIGKAIFSKTAAVLNDSIIIQANYAGLSKINTATGKSVPLPTPNKRTTCIGVAPHHMIYHGSTNGLYKFDFKKQHDISLAKNHPLLSERITAICATPDNYVWVATASNGVLALQNDNVVKIFSTDDGIISNSIKCISTGRPGEIWVGTNTGITILRYKNTPENFSYQNLTINDGLSSNIINEMLYSNDTMYCATGNGICAIPANISLLKFNIPVRLTGIAINSRDTAIADNYKLEYNRNNIEMHFAGVELGGHFNYFEYSIDKAEWQTMDANTLILQLNSGKHTVEIRAVDVNGNAGTKPLLISFAITTPFWRSSWFWIFFILISGGLIVWLVRKREIAKREAALQLMLNQKKLTELELQALKSQINPHFIFNCLNSIKLLNHQHKHAEAEKYLDSFAALLRSALEQSSLKQITLKQEIDFIENYLSLEKLRLPGKLSYIVETDKSIDPSTLLIPSMLLQPYIENAVKHGIAPLRKRQGLVQVRFYIKDNALIAEVKDNGNGIDKASHNPESTGIGIENTERRSRLYNIKSTITNLRSIDVNLTGTIVQLKIPLHQN